MCQHTSSLLNSHNATMQRCIDNAHRKGQLSSTLGIPQLRQLKPFLEQMTKACILWMEKWEVYWTDCFFMPQDLVKKGLLPIQVKQPPKRRWLSRIQIAWESWWLQVWGWHICLRWTFIQCHFYGTGFGIFGWEIYTQAIMISSKK